MTSSDSAGAVNWAPNQSANIELRLPYCPLCHRPLASQVWTQGLQGKDAHEVCLTTESLLHGTTEKSADR
ncbi:hypothetical protein PIIN_09245 [Serendipita indica DSM 11827]|uniref:Uncharacterized protein n=1 Tax=Serendipita indica (strain DSM 11827) TaxID=1109443 RepID=G4TVB8_SERID|nr:hypothetical protein PIIN_09245 [Serendipita indica DSM 11827]